MIKKIFLSIILSILFISNTFAAVLYVKSDGSGDCSTWANACKLQTALLNSTSGDQIWVQRGVYYPGESYSDSFNLKDGVAIYGGFLGTETQLNQRDWKNNLTILSGDIDKNDVNEDGNYIAETFNDIRGLNSQKIISISSNISSSTILDGFVITAGSGTYGGGIDNSNGSPILRNLIIIGNYVYYNGGGLYNYRGKPKIINVTFSGNYAQYWAGIYNYWSEIELQNVIFTENISYYGGGIYSSDDILMFIRNARFMHNRANYGGGIYNSWGTLEIQNSIFNDNIANNGGGLYNTYTLDSKIVNTKFIENNAFYGGGIYNYRTAIALTNVLISGNFAYYGGGVYNVYKSYPSFVNITLSKNYVTNFGGGIYNSDSNPILKNAIIWENSSIYYPNYSEIYNGNFSPTISYSDIKGCGGSGASWNAECGVDGGNNIDSDPEFLDIDSYNLRLKKNSPCIDSGDNSSLPVTITKDLDNFQRIVDGNSDGINKVVMGVYEFQNKLVLIYPNGGEIIDSGSNEMIYWYSPYNSHHFSLQLSTDDKKSWISMKNNITNNYFNWLVDPVKYNLNGNKNKSYIRVIAYDSTNTKIGTDASNKPFTIQVLKLISPNGGEILNAGKIHNIIWQTNATKSPVSIVSLQYSTDGGASWKNIVNLSSNTEQYLWTIPSAPSSKCKVKVILKDSYGNVIGSDVSDKSFTIK